MFFAIHSDTNINNVTLFFFLRLHEGVKTVENYVFFYYNADFVNLLIKLYFIELGLLHSFQLGARYLLKINQQRV